MPIALPLLLVASTAVQDPGGAAAAERAPRWIWPTSAIEDHQEAWLRKRFTLEAAPVAATLRGACDNRTNVWLNGELVAASAAWWTPYEHDVLHALRAGENVLACWAQNETSTAGAWMELAIELADGTRATIVTDASWRAALDAPDGFEAPDHDDAAWTSAAVIGTLGDPPWGGPDAPLDFEGGEALAAEELELADGFRAELLYSVPRVRQGSWVCLAPDDRGRLYASDQYGALYRIVPPPLGTSTETRVERIDVDLGEAQGLAWAAGALYAVVNGHGRYESGLWRARDRDGDDRLDTVELLAPLDGSGEHGPHAVRVAPDGRSLVVIAGNFTALPARVTRSRVTPAWGEDVLLPRIDDPNGHDGGILAPGGWLCRTDLEGRAWELVASGLRNAYDFDFDEHGDALTFDSDMEWDLGLPWYRPTRILHLVSGADFGWRNGSGKWEPHFPDSLPAVVDVGLSSPTGVEMGTRARFPGRWRRALFAADWAYGTLYAVHLEPREASHGASVEVLARGRPFPITDLCIGADGAMYVTTGGRQTQGGLYRITAREPVGEERVAAEESAGAPSAARATRVALERAHGVVDPDVVPLALAHLGDPDRFVRHAARVALEHQPLGAWSETALASGEPAALVNAIVALARVGPPALRERLVERFLALPLERLAGEELAAALRALELVLIRAGAPDAAQRDALLARLAPRFPSGEPRADRALCQLLAWLDAPGLVEKALARIEGDLAQEDRIHHAAALRIVRTGWSEEARRRYFAFLDDACAALAGGHSFTLFVERIRDDALARIGESERARLALWRDAREARRPRAVLDASFASGPARRWTIEELRELVGAPPSPRDLASGRRAFEKATCARCHRIRNDGGSTGPDLTGAGARFGRRDLLEAIVEPSRVISDQYRDQEIVTVDDELLVGRIEREDEGGVRVRLLPPAEEVITLDSAEIAARRVHPLSRMPAGLLDLLTRDEILDLFAYVLAGGDSTDPAFRADHR